MDVLVCPMGEMRHKVAGVLRSFRIRCGLSTNVSPRPKEPGMLRPPILARLPGFGIIAWASHQQNPMS